MGGVINVIAKFHNTDKFLEDIKIPALKLSAMYIGQVSIFFGTSKRKVTFDFLSLINLQLNQY